MSDALADDRAILSLNVIDDYNREELAVDVDLPMPKPKCYSDMRAGH